MGQAPEACAWYSKKEQRPLYSRSISDAPQAKAVVHRGAKRGWVVDVQQHRKRLSSVHGQMRGLERMAGRGVGPQNLTGARLLSNRVMQHSWEDCYGFTLTG